jgi:flagellar biosynthetic protein FliR
MLSQFLVSEMFAFILVFCRTGSAIMLLPGFGEQYVPPRIRLMLALTFSILLVPVIQAIPPMPTTGIGLIRLVIAEAMVGLFLGALGRILIAAVHVGGIVIAYQSSLSSAITNGINQYQGQDTSVGNMLGVTAVVLIFATNLHHLMLRGLADSYTLFLPGEFPPVHDFANLATNTVSRVFAMGIQIAAPNIVIGMMLYVGAGILSRLMPNMQIFFILMPPQLLLSFFIIMITISSIMLWYLDFFEQSLASFLTPR